MANVALFCLVAIAMPAGDAAPEETAPVERPTVGAIRWDAWHGPASPVGLIVEKTLAPAHWHHRLPFYGKVVGEVRGRGPR